MAFDNHGRARPIPITFPTAAISTHIAVLANLCAMS
jgi:hypothetical protein